MRDRSWTNLEIDAKIKRQNRLAHLLQKNESIVTATAQMTETHGDKLAALNELNRKRNREEVRAAQLAEERKRMAAFKAAIAKKKAEAEAKNSLAVPKKEHDDLFSDMSDISRTGSPAPGAAPKPKTVRETKNGIPTFTRPKMDDEIIGALDLEIDLEV
jgi:RNA polymerase-associated protein RTF1